MLKYKVGDTVKITSGKDKNRKGKIEKIFPKEGSLLIQGINIVKKHVKAAASADKKGGVYEIPKPLVFAKVALICPHCKKPTRIGFKMDKKKKVRICKKCKKEIDKKQ